MSTSLTGATTCVSCRQRKMRCDGRKPCGPCSKARTPLVCTYVPKIPGQLRSELPKGGACLPCHQRKRKCDGEFPCATCTATGRAHECQYQVKTRPGKSAEQTNHWDDSSAEDVRASSSTFLNQSQSQFDPLPRTTEDGITLHALPDLYAQQTQSSNMYSTSTNHNFLPDDDSSMNGRGYTPSDNNPLTSLIQSLRLGNPVDFSFDSGPVLDRSGELFELRNLFLNHYWQYGLNVTEEKRDALSRGDISGLLVHPILVNVSQLLGCQLANRLQLHSSQSRMHGREAEQALLIFDMLHSEENLLDLTTAMQVYNLLGVYHALNGNIVMYSELVHKLGALLLQNLDESLALDLGCPEALAQETRSAFSAIIFLDLSLCLELKAPPMLQPSLLATFRRLAAIHRNDTELNLRRARSALFVYDTQCLVAEWGELEIATRTIWSTRYANLVEDIYGHLKILRTPRSEASFIHDAQAFTLKTCIIIALAVLAKLHALFAPFRVDSQQKHEEVIGEMASLTTMFAGKDFKYLDTMLGVCWAAALRPLLHHEPSTELREESAVFKLLVGESTTMDILHECFLRLRIANPCTPPNKT